VALALLQMSLLAALFSADAMLHGVLLCVIWFNPKRNGDSTSRFQLGVAACIAAKVMARALFLSKHTNYQSLCQEKNERIFNIRYLFPVF
jgi:hypothetical protein